MIKRLIDALMLWLERQLYDNRPLASKEPAAEEPKLKTWRDDYTADQVARLDAFLDMISYAEGTDRYGQSQGYDVLVGGELFTSYEDHPRQSVFLPRYKIHSTAAGRYQILARYWDHYKVLLSLPDFGPDSQDRYAIQNIREQRALNDVLTERPQEAIRKCANIWASFPGAGYGQREVRMTELLNFFWMRLEHHRQ